MSVMDEKWYKELQEKREWMEAVIEERRNSDDDELKNDLAIYESFLNAGEMALEDTGNPWDLKLEWMNWEWYDDMYLDSVMYEYSRGEGEHLWVVVRLFGPGDTVVCRKEADIPDGYVAGLSKRLEGIIFRERHRMLPCVVDLDEVVRIEFGGGDE
jgi:hypothetical protein